MKIKNVFASLVFASLTCSANVFAGNYAPPESLYCMLNSANQLSCKDFNRNYLREDTTTADLEQAKAVLFNFASAVAYFTTNQEEASIFFTYKNNHLKMVKLKTIHTSMRPDLKNGKWNKFKDDIYTCNVAVMNCLITNLPE